MIYDAEEELYHSCCICYRDRPRLINPCRCGLQYHQLCLLKYIRSRLTVMKSSLNLSQIRCGDCHDQIRFKLHKNVRCSCRYFLGRMQNKECSASMIVFFIMLVIAVVLCLILTISVEKGTVIFWVLLVLESLVLIGLFIVMYYFAEKNFTYMEITLVRVYAMAELMRSNNTTESEADSPILAPNIEIVIEGLR